MVLYNSATRTKETLQTLEEGVVRLYLCGPTVYDDAHLGHARSAIAFDLLRRVLREEGYRVLMARNITDIDDKIINKAKLEGTSTDEIAARFTERYHADMDALGVERPDIEPKATESLSSMSTLVEKLRKSGHAYQTADGDWYFAVDADKRYGRLSNRDEEEAQSRVDHEAGKKNPRDFALWKASIDPFATFKTPLGQGRPGWHLECSAMIAEHLAAPSGPYQIDIHGGGSDLFFPHHENEAAQTRCAYNQELARYWVHNGFVTINNEKMSKSLGNSFFVKDALAHYNGEVLRNYLIATHYRAHFNYSLDDLAAAKKRLDRLYRLAKRVAGTEPAQRAEESFQTPFMAALADDLNISVALAEVEAMIARANDALDKSPKDKTLKAAIVANLALVARVLGLGTNDPIRYFQLGVSDADKVKIEALIEARHNAKKTKDFATADTIRNELTAMGITLMDTPEGTLWEKSQI